MTRKNKELYRDNKCTVCNEDGFSDLESREKHARSHGRIVRIGKVYVTAKEGFLFVGNTFTITNPENKPTHLDLGLMDCGREH